jgi:thioredoxin-like negative regulator of GroEL
MEMMPIVDGLSEEFEGQVSVVQLNAAQEANARMQNQWGLRGHPSFAVLDANGSIVQQFFGPQPAATLREAMESIISE